MLPKNMRIFCNRIVLSFYCLYCLVVLCIFLYQGKTAYNQALPVKQHCLQHRVACNVGSFATQHHLQLRTQDCLQCSIAWNTALPETQRHLQRSTNCLQRSRACNTAPPQLSFVIFNCGLSLLNFKGGYFEFEQIFFSLISLPVHTWQLFLQLTNI